MTSGSAPTRAASEAAHFVEAEAQEIRRRLHSSRSLGMGGRGVVEELWVVADASRNPNWDGYGAAPVEPETLDQAYRFLEALPLGLPIPSVGAEADGHLTFEWYCSPTRVLSASISPEGMIYYAALLSGSKRSGTEHFMGQVPEDLLDIIRRLFPA